MISEAQTSAINFYNREYRIRRTGGESVQIRSFFWSVFLLFVLNTGKIRTRFRHFSRRTGRENKSYCKDLGMNIYFFRDLQLCEWSLRNEKFESFWSRIQKRYTNCSTVFFGKTVNQTLSKLIDLHEIINLCFLQCFGTTAPNEYLTI